jgi:catechol 2,3-dioxygenase-like lactoylglutathione lyase family enzyme
MIDHLTLKVRSFEQAKAFYAAALEPLGYEVLMEFEGSAGLGAGKPDVWLAEDPANARPTHLAIAATDRKAVDAFHAAALAAGGKDNGKPGVRAQYDPDYYAAYVLDPEGNNLEAVCHQAPKRRRAATSSRRNGSRRREAEARSSVGGVPHRGADPRPA